MKSTDHPAYTGAITLFLREHGQATPGQLHYHITGKREVIEACLTALVEGGELERCGTETTGAYQGQPLYCLKRQPYQEERARITRYLEQANEELLGLHRYGAMTYLEYTHIADLLIEAQERLKKHFQAETRREESARWMRR